jgi:arginine/lysine/ornithine decarboxylase
MKDRKPLVEKLKSHISENPVSFHVPGHKGNPTLMDAGTNLWDTVLGYDITELHNTDNLHLAAGVIKEAQDLVAGVYGVEQTYFLVNGSTAGVLASLLAVTRPGDTVMVDRHCHSSVLNGLMLGRVKPIFVGRPIDSHTGIPMSVDAQAINRAFVKNNNIKAVIVTSPSYYGICSDLMAIAETAGNNGAVLVVDEAHGAHLKFWDGLPVSAVDCGADIVVQSAHKTLPALTQGAWLHVTGKRVDKGRLERMLGIIQTTSPSYPIMASLDTARYIMATSGDIRLKEIWEYTFKTRMRINGLDNGLFCPDREYFRERDCYDYDETKLIINCTKAGIGGYQLDLALRKESIYGELYDLANWLGVVTVASRAEDLDRLVKGCRKVKKQPAGKEIILPSFDIPDICCGIEPWKVLEREWASIELDAASGMISATGIVPYPPGIPLVYPGERFNALSIEHIKKCKALCISIKGVCDGQVEVIKSN